MQDEENKTTDEVSESSPIVGHIREKFYQSENSRLYDEKRWLKAYRNYRGLYGPEMVFRSNEKSRVFVKVTKTKVLAAYAQIVDVLFAGSKFPIGIDVPSVPKGAEDSIYFDQNEDALKKEQQKNKIKIVNKTLFLRSLLDELLINLLYRFYFNSAAYFL